MVVAKKIMIQAACGRLREYFQQLNTAANMIFPRVKVFVIPVIINVHDIRFISLGSLQRRNLGPSFDLVLRFHNTNDELGNTLKPKVHGHRNFPMLGTTLHALLTRKIVG